MKKKTTKRALLISALSLLLCLSMFVGSTFAWFTDSVTSGNNIIKSGTLDIVLEYWDGKSWVDAEGKIIPFVAADGREQSQILWEPGCTYKMAPFRVRNEGSLNAKILILINGITGDEKLMEVIELKTGINNIPESLLNGSAGNVFKKFEGTQVDIIYGMPEGNIVFDHSLAGKGTVTPGTGHTDTSPEFTISGHMAEEAGNEYQNLSIEGISITVIATQQTYEVDSFDKWYDKNATYPNVSAPISIPNEDVTEAITLYKNGVKVVIPAAVVNALPADVTSISLVFDNPVVENNTLSFSYFELVDQNGTKIDLENNTEAITVTLPVKTAFAPGTAIAVYHDDVKMVTTSVADDGSISYSAKNFRQISVTQPKDAYYVATYDDFYTEVYYGGTVIPTADVNLSKFIVSPNTADIYLNGKNITGSANFFFYAPVESAKLSVNGGGTVTTNTGYVSFVTNKGTFTVNGGTFNLGSTKEKAHFFTQNSGKTIINGGTFISKDADTPIIYCINGFVEINGGFFQNTANPNQALLSIGNNLNYANNQKITLSGGTFVNWNPMDSAFARPWTNQDVPAMIVLADGYQMISETQANGDVWYSVVPNN